MRRGSTTRPVGVSRSPTVGGRSGISTVAIMRSTMSRPGAPSAASAHTIVVFAVAPASASAVRARATMRGVDIDRRDVACRSDQVG
jgi:hypothetical protein